MKALALYGIGDLRYEETPIPKRNDDEVLLKVRAVGICGSDIPRVFDKGTYHFPTIIGHEFSGEIVEADDNSLIGKRASVFPLIPCQKCEACQNFHYAQCKNYDYYGSRRNGAMAEYIAVKKQNLSFIPDGVTFEEAAMNEPAAVAMHAFKKSDVKPNDTVLIYGIGTIGLIFAQIARASGVKNITLVGRTKEKIQFAKKLNFLNVIDKNIEKLNTNPCADVCVEGTGDSEALNDCAILAKNFSKIICLGNPLKEMTLSQDAYWKILRKELSLFGVWNSNFNHIENDWKDALLAVKENKIDLKSLITHKFLLKDYKKAFEMMKNKSELYCKVMFVMEE